MRNEHIEGHEWGTYVALVRSTVTEHGMAYRARARRSRSANSTRGGHVPPGHTGEPCTGGSGTGGWMTWRCEVREMRSAAAARAIVRGDSEKATGELIDTETVTSSSEEGRWKRAARYLAGGLSYRMHGSNGGIGETCRKATRPDPTHLRRSRFRQRLSRSVDMIDIANGCAKRTYKSDFWRNRCVNHHYFLICTQGKS
jgi:hypothetical protein